MSGKKELIEFYRTCQKYFDELESCTVREKIKEASVQALFRSIESGDVYVDLGCGSGTFVISAAKLRNAYAIGTDISPAGCKLANKLSKTSRTEDKTDFIVCDADALPFKEEILDKISSFEVLEHLTNPEKSLSEMIRAAKKDGEIFLRTPHYMGGSFGPLSKPISILRPFARFPWFLNAYIRHRLNQNNFILIHAKPFLEHTAWEAHSLKEMADKDAVSWIYSISLLDFFSRKHFTIITYDTWIYQKDALLRNPQLNKLGQFRLMSLDILSKTPFFKHFGPCIFLIVRKNI